MFKKLASGMKDSKLISRASQYQAKVGNLGKTRSWEKHDLGEKRLKKNRPLSSTYSKSDSFNVHFVVGDLVDDESGNEIIQHFLGDAVATHPLSGCCIPAVVHEARFAGHLNKIQIIPGVGNTNSPRSLQQHFSGVRRFFSFPVSYLKSSQFQPAICLLVGRSLVPAFCQKENKNRKQK